MRFVKPIDRSLILELARTHSLLMSIEENSLVGGAGSEVGRVLEESSSPTCFVRMGIPDRFVGQGDQALLLAEIGLDKEGILQAARAWQDVGR